MNRRVAMRVALLALLVVVHWWYLMRGAQARDAQADHYEAVLMGIEARLDHMSHRLEHRLVEDESIVCDERYGTLVVGRALERIAKYMGGQCDAKGKSEGNPENEGVPLWERNAQDDAGLLP